MAEMKKVFGTLLALGLAGGAFAATAFARVPAGTGAATPETAAQAGLTWQPFAPAYAEYVENGGTGGYVPSPIDASLFSAPRAATGYNAAQSFPEKFDLRTMGLVSSVKNQSPYDTCWSFAALASVESGLIGQYPWIDLSERQLVWASYGFGDAWGGVGAGPMQWGGWNQISTATMAHFFGPVAENRSPYIDEPITQEQRAESEFHLTEVGYLPCPPVKVGADRVQDDILKTLLMGKGALSVAYNASAGALDAAHCSYYNAAPDGANHEVTLIGWDDTFPGENFAVQAPGDGAWLIKNSWGTGVDYQNGGYFWLSYYDQTMTDGAFYEVSEESMEQEVAYYDAAGWNTSLSFDAEDGAYAANVFTADKAASLEAVGLYTGDSNTQATVTVYTDGGTGVWDTAIRAEQTVFEPYAGYHTVTLEQSVPVQKGEQYAIVYNALNTNEGKESLIPVELGGQYVLNSANATVEPGESYIYLPEFASWMDAYDVGEVTQGVRLCNACISAILAPQGAAVRANAAQQGGQALLSSLMIGRDDRKAVELPVFEAAGGPTANAPLPLKVWEREMAADEIYLWPMSTGTVKINGETVTYPDGLYQPTRVEGVQEGKNTIVIEVSEEGKQTTTYTLDLTLLPQPSATPSAMPSAVPSATPSAAPSATPSATPSAVPSAVPTAAPTAVPTVTPGETTAPTALPVLSPTPRLPVAVVTPASTPQNRGAEEPEPSAAAITEEKKIPQTADESEPLLCAVLMVVSLPVCAALCRRKRGR